MKTDKVIWLVLLLLGGGFLLIRGVTVGNGSVYVRTAPVVNESGVALPFTEDQVVKPSEHSQPGVHLSWTRTLGVWIAGLATLSILSFLWGDNVFYKLAESVFVGASAGYAMVVGFWTGIVQNLLGKLGPGLMRVSLLPGLPADSKPEWIYLIPLVLSILMLWRLAPKGGWISRWPLAFFIGATAGIRLVGYFQSDFVNQVQATMLPLIVMTADGRVDWTTSLTNTTIVLGVLACLVYFFFSLEHTGVVGRISRVGIWLLMMTFGAGFAYTVMGRITLLSERLAFLFDDWLWLIDPLGNRVGM